RHGLEHLIGHAAKKTNMWVRIGANPVNECYRADAGAAAESGVIAVEFWPLAPVKYAQTAI
ncbi:hypothetical protein, partial [Rhodoferax sp. UBA5149]|uniref:hypothetical protein n=1 Tax=Rhodoferax sp. UBA5149 TaxID=1947379 RepID=UPI0025F6CD7D